MRKNKPSRRNRLTSVLKVSPLAQALLPLQELGHPASFCHRMKAFESRKRLTSFPTYVEVPGPCDPEDLIDGIIFAANCLGSTQMLSEKTPSKNIRMIQAQEAVNRIKVNT
ncbi:amyloid beta A4 precursor protein-binding family A member 1-like isoform X2 [Poecilia formosa]|uniref:amyloid beta A4 precursor protein-binding family A member 1-like isoform X2 n=1 Tax=Poecilia formosa TaxID=48698 RepID=UPI0007B8E3BC|nr:PREDICTED: amyloid beta A4 precursor protein-binding family A member 1-like isoform X2 [Poecilia formosa]